MTLLHASCVEFEGKGIIIFGPSGSGKSDLALRLIDSGARLVSDDYVNVDEDAGILFAHPAPNIAGMIEVRGVGLIKLGYKKSAKLDLALELTPEKEIERLPKALFYELDGAKIPLYKIDAFSGSAVAKIRLMLKL
ncbi:MAG: HPr kinase/phosphatase C-terminal domain-containing protein [Kordiimonadaceae bacterium]|nr:HPr kinase/phosphatase C-terminal domain-containing protein [Kordiimonadaceae bacterium]